MQASLAHQLGDIGGGGRLSKSFYALGFDIFLIDLGSK
jgi:hypothetical protein